MIDNDGKQYPIMPTTDTLGSDLFSEGFENVSNILLLGSPMESRQDVACADLLTITPPSEESVLSITFNQTPDERLQVWKCHVGDEMPAAGAIIAVGEQTRSLADTGSVPSETDQSLSIATVSDPRNLTRLGVEITDYLGKWEASPTQLVVCFHSITALLQYSDEKSVFRFFHILTQKIVQSGGVAHYHLDPKAHDEQTVNRLIPLFDAVVEPTEDGDWNVRQP